MTGSGSCSGRNRIHVALQHCRSAASRPVIQRSRYRKAPMHLLHPILVDARTLATDAAWHLATCASAQRPFTRLDALATREADFIVSLLDELAHQTMLAATDTRAALEKLHLLTARHATCADCVAMRRRASHTYNTLTDLI